MLIEVDALQAVLGEPDWQILDVSDEAAYLQCHIPGAIWVDFQALVMQKPPAMGEVPSTEALIAYCDSRGIDPNKKLVVCEQGMGLCASRLFWTLHYLGHQDVYFLNGGLKAWVNARAPLTNAVTQTPPVQGQWPLNPAVNVNCTQIREAIDDPQVVLWDTRSKEEFIGHKKLADRAGHIPGAAHFEWSDCINQDDNLRLHSPDTLRAQLKAAGISADKTVYCYCQAHRRSAFAFMVGKILGFEHIAAYPGAWSEWGNLPELPISEHAA